MTEISTTGDLMLGALECVATHGPVTTTQCARLCDINRTVAHRLLTTLARRLYIIKIDGGYVLGPTCAAIGAKAKPSIVSIAKPDMIRLAHELQETIVLHGIADGEAVVLDQALDLTHVVVVRHNPGSRHPLHRGASGWSMLAFLPKQVTDKHLASLTASEAASARSRITKTRGLGYAHSQDELQLGVHGLAAPICGADGIAVASVGILVPQSRATKLVGMARALLSCAKSITSQFSELGPESRVDFGK